MSPVTTRQRLYLAAVAVLAVYVGICCYFDPAYSDNGIPWQLPPLCATFLGSMYFAGTIAMIAGIVSRRWAEIRVIIPMTVIWTGGLTIVSLFYLPKFDFTRTQVWVWFAAYIAYPIIGIIYMWIYRSEARVHDANDVQLPTWVKLYLPLQGTLLTLLASALLFVPQTMQSLWGWKTGIMMLQLYSMPLLAMGIGSFLLARQETWSEIRAGVFAIAVFMILELAASLRFQSVQDGPSLSVFLWIAWLAVTGGVSTLLAIVSLRRAPIPIGHPTRVEWHSILRPFRTFPYSSRPMGEGLGGEGNSSN